MKNKLVQLFILLLTYQFGLSQSSLSELPDWFFDESNYNNRSRIIGISDMNMPEDEAFEQAKNRALLNYSILHTAKFTSLNTLGLGNQLDNPGQINSTEYVLYTSIIRGNLIHSGNITCIDSFITLNKEAIVLLELNSIIKPDSNSIFEIVRNAGFQRENNSLPLFIDELGITITTQDSIKKQTFLYKEQGQIKEKESKNKQIFDYIVDYRRYYQYKNKNNVNSKTTPMPLNKGLWNAYIFNLIDQISIYSSFKNNRLNKLSTSSLGNITDEIANETFQQYVYSLKNIYSEKFETKLETIGINENQLYLSIKSETQQATIDLNSQLKPNRKTRKELIKIQKDKWQCIGNQDIEKAWLEAKNIGSYLPNLVISTKDVRSNDLNSGFIQAIQLAKLEISSQLDAKISALNNIEQNNTNNSLVHSAKLSDISKMDQIKPYYLFYRKINPIAYQIKAVLCYQMD
ncbi:MAG: hypothetical protein P1P88_08350 [Bacteroidales bacterium]|nr:hypothetical protein [Bacteroidales bacterium]